MNIKKVFALLGLAGLLVVAAFSCQRSHYCLCVSTDADYIDTMIVNVDNSMSCKGIQQLGVLRPEPTENGHVLMVDSVYHFTCVKLKKDSLPNYNGLHLQR